MKCGAMRLALGAATLCLLVLPGCGHSVPQPVQQITSSDGHLTALIGLDEGSAVIGGDWYFVEIDQAHPAWYQFLPRMRGAGVCSLQGRGAIRIRWSGPRELTVTCSDCDRSRFYIDKREWKGATIKYSFPS
ncbi:MAG: hypothetical protein ACRD4X_12085, partial [Candidatus Acidiferrales bacterium]